MTRRSLPSSRHALTRSLGVSAPGSRGQHVLPPARGTRAGSTGGPGHRISWRAERGGVLARPSDGGQARPHWPLPGVQPVPGAPGDACAVESRRRQLPGVRWCHRGKTHPGGRDLLRLRGVAEVHLGEFVPPAVRSLPVLRRCASRSRCRLPALPQASGPAATSSHVLRPDADRVSRRGEPRGGCPAARHRQAAGDCRACGGPISPGG